MYLPFFKKSSFGALKNFSNLDCVSRDSSLKVTADAVISGLPVSKVVVHLAWFKEYIRGFCEVDEVFF